MRGCNRGEREMPAKYRPDQDAHRRLRHAAWKGDVRLARSMLARCVLLLHFRIVDFPLAAPSPPAPVVAVLLPCLGCPPCNCCRFSPAVFAIFPHKQHKHRGAKLEATDGDQYTPLLIAARWNRIDMVKVRDGLFWLDSSFFHDLCGFFLLPEPRGFPWLTASRPSPLLPACALMVLMSRNCAMQFLLEESGAKMTAKNNEGDNAYNLAILYGHTELAKYLEESGCDTAENSLRQSRKASTDEWLAMAVRRTPSNAEISKMREKVHKNFNALEKEKTKAGKGALPAQSTEDKAVSAAAVEAATGLEGEEAAKHLDAGAPVGQITFPVGQRIVKKAPHACRLGIGSMGLAMFDGVVPVATWPYKYIDAVLVQAGSKSSKVILMLNTGKMRKIAFQTLRPDELAAAIEAKMDELAMHQAASPIWSPRLGDERALQGGALPPEPEPEPESSPTGSDSKITLDGDRSIWVSSISALIFHACQSNRIAAST